MKSIRKSSVVIGCIMGLLACTNLEIEEKDSIVIQTESGAFEGVASVPDALNGAFNDVQGNWSNADNIYALSLVTTDEFLVPTRGTDWGDNGVWRTLHAHTWDASHQRVLNVWNDLNGNVYKLNQILHPASEANALQVANAKFLRAFNMWHIVDLFRQVPFRTPDDAVDKIPEVWDAATALDFIMDDVDAAIAGLPSSGPDLTKSERGTKEAALFLKAKILLNKHVYLGTTAVAADMTALIDAVDDITAAGYELHDGYFDIFKNTQDSETIWHNNGGIGHRIWSGLHYSQKHPDNTGGGWNGFSTTADFYSLFEGDPNTNSGTSPSNYTSNQEERRGWVPTEGVTGYYTGYGMLIGQQVGPAGELLKDRQGGNLIYSKSFAAEGADGLLGNGEKEGVRVIKYHPNDGAFTGHTIMFRYADAYLMKIEAILRGGTSSDAAETLFDNLRDIRKCSTDKTATLAELINERGRELYQEHSRRQDLIRFGLFDKAFGLKDVEDPNRIIFPIPNIALGSNPNLVQNPGY